MSLLSPLSPSGHMKPGPFIMAVLAVYLLSFGSQALLAPQVTARAGVWAFAIVQAVLIWVWYALHVRRLNDAGRPAGLAMGIAIVYALEVLLLVIVVWLILTSGFEEGGTREEAGLLRLFVFLYLIARLTGDPALGGLGYWLMGFAVVLLLPVAIALGFTLWAATRKSARTAP
jgi:uncharacterized membrane protein YhaH (DUF805 family)